MKILIFGGGGFIGSNLAATLRPLGFSLKTMDNGKKSVTKADIALDLNHASETELTNLMLDVDVVINLVAESAVLSSSKPQEMYETNAFSAQKLYRRHQGRELVNFFSRPQQEPFLRVAGDQKTN